MPGLNTQPSSDIYGILYSSISKEAVLWTRKLQVAEHSVYYKSVKWFPLALSCKLLYSFMLRSRDLDLRLVS
jgi:membrane protein CcdC involved in cytochrome C biogenesis